MKEADIMTEFFTLSWLGTAAGIVAAVAIMVEVCKYLLPALIPAMKRIDPRWYCVFWSIAFNIAFVLWIQPATGAADYFCAVINSLLVAVAATGTFEYVIKPIERKVSTDNENQGGD
jgi:hypothetical protein